MRAVTALALLVLGTASIAGAVALRPPNASAPAGAGQKVFDISGDLAQVTRLEVTGSGKASTLVLRKGVWVIEQRGFYPAQPAKMRAVFSGMAASRLLEPRTADPTLFARLGVDDPKTPNSTATLLQAKNEKGDVLAAVILGHRSQRSRGGLPESVYVRRPDQDQSWLAEGTLPADSDPQSWLVREIADIPRTRIAKVSVQRGADHLDFTRTGDKMTVTPPPTGKPDDYRIDEIAQSLEGLTLADVKQGALPGTPVGTSVFTTTDGLVMTIALTRDGAAVWASFEATGTGADIFANLKGWAYQLPEWREKALVPAPSDLIDSTPAK